MYYIIGIIVLVILWAIVAYNGFVRKVNHAKEALSDIDIQLKRRYDLIPNLVNTVKGYASHETSAFQNVTAARAAAMGATGLANKSVAEDKLSGSLKSIFAIAEAYPDLKANQNFLSLQSELSDTEDKIQSARRFYNSTAMELNTSAKSFPGNMIAGSFHFSPMEYFALDASDAAAKNPVSVNF
ncbi:MAG TPA: LemA family protein [Candidatus Paceibacterota bacterium]|nr:LemA family protein [Candidatus Paceibacterota bacterium]